MSAVGVVSAEIRPNQAVSGGVDLGTNQLVAFEIPANFTAATLTFQSKSKQKGTADIGDDTDPEEEENWRNVFDTSGTEISITVTANKVVVPTAAIAAALAPLRYLRIRSGTAASPVTINPGGIIKILTKLA